MPADPGPALDLHGKVAIVTGGASGIGSAIAGTFAAKGATVAILDVQAGKAAALFLACDDSLMINGADIVVDGGYTIR